MSSDSNNNQKGGYSKKSRYFWQYNVQAKGPKGQRLIIKTQAGDPHSLLEPTDPVFSPNCSIRGIKVSPLYLCFMILFVDQDFFFYYVEFVCESILNILIN